MQLFPLFVLLSLLYFYLHGLILTLDVYVDVLCSTLHRDYKRIEWASREKSRDKLNKSNGGSGI